MQQKANIIFVASSGSYRIGDLKIWNLAPNIPKAFSEQRRALDNLEQNNYYKYYRN